MKKLKFCSLCGKELVLQTLDGTNRKKCQSCEFINFNNPKPAVAAVIIKDRKILLVKRAINPHQGKWQIPGGFVESGESLEGGLKREIKEELGVDIEILDYLESFGDGYSYGVPEETTVNIYFMTKIKQGRLKNDHENQEIKFFDLNKLPSVCFKNNRMAIESYIKWNNKKPLRRN